MSPSKHDPIRAISRFCVATGAVSAIGVVAAAIWALRVPPAAPVLVEFGGVDSGVPGIRSSGREIEWGVFSRSIWSAFPEDPAAQQTQPPPEATTPRLQLLAISTDGIESRSALVFDPATHRAVRVASGESVGAYRITTITTGHVDLTAEGRSYRLSLRSEEQ